MSNKHIYLSWGLLSAFSNIINRFIVYLFFQGHYERKNSTCFLILVSGIVAKYAEEFCEYAFWD